MTTESKTEWPAETAQRVIDSLEEEVRRAECMAKVYDNEIGDSMFCARWKGKADDLRTDDDMIRRAYLGGSDT